MSFFKTKKVSVETLGEYLRDTRTAFKLSLQQVNRLTQIPTKFLQNLEEANYEALPADVYVKGFLKSLAAVYRMPADVLLDQFDHERGLARSLKRGPLVPRVSLTAVLPRILITPKTFLVSLVLLAAAGSLGYLIWQVRSVSAAPELKVIYPERDFTSDARSVLLRGQTEPGARVYVNGQEILVEENGAFQEVLNLSEGANTLAVKAENKFHKSTDVNRVIVVTAPNDIVTTTPAFDQEAIVLAVSVGPDDTWISATADGQIIQEGIVAAGQKLTLRAEKELLLTTGNAGSTRLTYNGKDLGILGRVGEVLSNIKFTR